MEIKKANTNSKGVLNNRAYRDALKKAGLAEGVGLTTKFVILQTGIKLMEELLLFALCKCRSKKDSN